MNISKALCADCQVALQKGSANYTPAAANECFAPTHTLASIEHHCFIHC